MESGMTKDIFLFIEHLLNNSTPDNPAWNIEAKLSGKPPKWNYIDGCMIKAILDIYEVTKNNKYLDFADSFIGYFIDENNGILGYDVSEYNSDSINEGKTLLTLYQLTQKEKYKKACDLLYSQLKTHPRTESGSFWHKQIYPNQIWLDGLYMVEPFYMEYEMKYNNKENYMDIFKQFENVEKLMADQNTGLFYHGYDESKSSFWANKQTGLSPNFWTRSLGWYAMALVDTAEKFDGSLDDENFKLPEYFKKYIDALIAFRDEKTKLFYQVPNMGEKEGNYLETSGSCAIAYAIMKGARLGYLPENYYGIGEEIFMAVIDNKLAIGGGEFLLRDICLVAGLGGMPGKGDYKQRDGSFEYYISEPRVDNDAKGVAPFLYAFAEVLRK